MIGARSRGRVGAMRWSSYAEADRTERAAVWRDGWLHPAGARRLIDLLGGLREAAEEALAGPGVDPSTVRLLPPVPRPPSVRDFMAFEEHVVTASAAIGLTVDPLWYRQPVFYFTNPAALRGAHDPVPVSPGSATFDYELEVAAVIGREGADLTPEEAVEHIAGYTIFCDWSARDLQGEEMRLNLGPAKGKDSASSCGPWRRSGCSRAAPGWDRTSSPIPPWTCARRAGRRYPIAPSPPAAPAPRHAHPLPDHPLERSVQKDVNVPDRGRRERAADVRAAGVLLLLSLRRSDTVNVHRRCRTKISFSSRPIATGRPEPTPTRGRAADRRADYRRSPTRPPRDR
jgi:2-keto-4-pentenoate hydratase/2-oxohepta-3-ene-1,7-dioic acid hydratase in catechol pathway